MPIFLDVHKIPEVDKDVQEIVNAPPDEFGVRHVNIFFNREADIFYCLLEAPDRQSVEKHHAKFNIKPDWITEVTQVK
ncbi:MAG: DUF4242 domain-containing protein [Nitrososphaeraceae archaeon]|nr:DUF4242 domain-containing protein [Nitrososphaeraceae archaeon]